MSPGLFSKKGKKAEDVKLCIINRFDRDEFFRSLREYGWEQIEGPFEFERNWKHERVRKSAREYAADIDGDILVEIRDREFSTNPYNDYVYFIWRGTAGVRGIPPPPSYQQTAGFTVAQQMQMQQAAARIQNARAMPQAPQPAPQVVSTGGTCPQCKANQVNYFNNGLAQCPQCGGNFQWQPPAQPAQPPAPQPPASPPQPPPPRQPPARVPPQQVQLPPQQSPPSPTQQPVQPQQQPTPVPRQQPAAPQPQPQQPTSYCPKCRVPLTKYPDGRMVCSKCGLGGK